ncbi:hypothetical protein SteCoe_29999 [Stentor coeruleus]|uniref:B box-type domain-containing protein n=1 Tax=Stentor coeruleus TaxID=5963 RepID=A0A1R2B4I7_9CILI|nr:hypothetical protein SteCoe_29999 [Stentor coeruleus]
MSDAPSKKKSGKKGKRKESSSPKSRKSPKSKGSSELGSLKEDPLMTEIAGNSCFRHHKEVKYFCELHEEVLCEECLSSAPYTTSPSKICKIDEAYRKKFTSVYQILNSQIFPKRDQLKSQINKINNKISEVQAAKGFIEKDMKSEFSALNERLNSNFGTKFALLEYDVQELQSDLDRIDYVVNSIHGANSDIQGFLNKYTEIRDTTDLILAKPFRTEIDIDPYSLPKELSEIRENVVQYPALKNLLQTKDEIIWKLTHEVVNNTSKVDENTQKELAEWANLTEKFSSELARYRMICEYCGIPLDNISVNTNCSRNLGNRHYFNKIN